jgi:hypothetical protein
MSRHRNLREDNRLALGLFTQRGQKLGLGYISETQQVGSQSTALAPLLLESGLDLFLIDQALPKQYLIDAKGFAALIHFSSRYGWFPLSRLPHYPAGQFQFRSGPNSPARLFLGL